MELNNQINLKPIDFNIYNESYTFRGVYLNISNSIIAFTIQAINDLNIKEKKIAISVRQVKNYPFILIR